MYYLQSRYYDPETRRFINADNVGVVSSDYLTTLGGQNLYSYCLNDPINAYDPTGHTTVGAIIGLVIAIAFFAWAVFGLIQAIKAFIKEPSWLNLLFVVLAVIEVVMSAIAVWQAFKAVSVAFKAARGAKFINTIDDTATSAAKMSDTHNTRFDTNTFDGNGKIPCNGNCFKEGTQVLTEEGYKNIEDVKVGDKVLAYDEETGEQAYKPVKQLFRNTTEKWCTVSVLVGDVITEIVSTPSHKYYLSENTLNREVGEKQEHASYIGLSEKWVSAHNLRKGDKVLLSDGSYGIVETVKIEELANPETTYNFEVADFHTYFVGEQSVCVHNVGCGGTNAPNSPEKVKASYIKQNKIDAHALKKEILGNKSKDIAKFDIFKDKANSNRIWLGNKSQTVWHDTGYYIDDLLTYFGGI